MTDEEISQLADEITHRLEGELFRMPEELKSQLMPNTIMPYMPIYTESGHGDWNLQVRVTAERNLVFMFVSNDGRRLKEFVML